jgi:GTPase SAR1 family protein
VERYHIVLKSFAPISARKFLIGNKVDLIEKRQVSLEKAKEFASKFGLTHYETSAKTAFNVEESFIAMTKEIIAHWNQKDKNLYKLSTVKEVKNVEIKKKTVAKLNKKE